MADTIYYIDSKQPLNTDNVSAVICKTNEVLNYHITACHKTDTAVLIENDITALAQCQLDGIYFSKKIPLGEFKDIRNNYPNLSIGINCGLSKHDGLRYGEVGADFIAFTGDSCDSCQLQEIVNWWSEMVQIPVVVVGAVDSETLADFIILATNS